MEKIYIFIDMCIDMLRHNNKTRAEQINKRGIYSIKLDEKKALFPILL